MFAFWIWILAILLVSSRHDVTRKFNALRLGASAQRRSRSFKLVINYDRSRNDADRQNRFIFRINCSHSKINDDDSHTCIRSCASLRAYLAFCFSTWRMRSLRKHSEDGTRFETATLTGLIAGEWQFNNIHRTMRLIFWLVYPYRVCFGFAGPSSKPEAHFATFH